MARTERLMMLLQLLRSYRYPVKAQILADKLNISIRTVYRDLELLRFQGANIQGEAGLGFLLVQDLALPPLGLEQSEVEALVLGLRWVSRHADEHLVNAAKSLFHKIQCVVPEVLKQNIHESPLLVGSEYQHQEYENNWIQEIRHAIESQKVIFIAYLDLKNSLSERRIYPVGLAYFNDVRLIIAWCEIRTAFRHFRVDRIQDLQQTNEKFQPDRAFLLKKWFQETGIPSQDFYLDSTV